jgi:hypothetical protein
MCVCVLRRVRVRRGEGMGILGGRDGGGTAASAGHRCSRGSPISDVDGSLVDRRRGQRPGHPDRARERWRGGAERRGHRAVCAVGDAASAARDGVCGACVRARRPQGGRSARRVLHARSPHDGGRHAADQLVRRGGSPRHLAWRSPHQHVKHTLAPHRPTACALLPLRSTG